MATNLQAAIIAEISSDIGPYELFGAADMQTLVPKIGSPVLINTFNTDFAEARNVYINDDEARTDYSVT